MTERFSPTRITDTELIDQQVTVTQDMEEPINHATARVIASQIGAGPTSAMHLFVTTEAVQDGLMYELTVSHEDAEDDEAQVRRVGHLAVYVAARKFAQGAVGPMPGWSRLWLEQPDQSDYCPCCSEHISANHRVGCPLGVDDEEQLDRVQALQAEHGPAVLHWLNYAGFRNMEELETRVRQFPEFFYGFFPSIDVFRANYEVSPNEYLEQQYEIMEADGGVYVFDRELLAVPYHQLS